MNPTIVNQFCACKFARRLRVVHAREHPVRPSFTYCMSGRVLAKLVLARAPALERVRPVSRISSR